MSRGDEALASVGRSDTAQPSHHIEPGRNAMGRRTNPNDRRGSRTQPPARSRAATWPAVGRAIARHFATWIAPRNCAR